MNDSHSMSLFDIYEKNALYRGEACSLHFNGTNISHKTLFSQTSALARGIEKSGITPGSRVAVLCKNHPVFFDLFGAAAALNLVLVLINRRLTRDEIAYIMEDTTPCIMICDNEMAETGQEISNSLSFVEQCYVVEPKKSTPENPDNDSKNISSLYIEGPGPVPVPCKTDDPYIIIHTAAVQGKPRGAVLSQSNVILSNIQTIQAFGLDDATIHLDVLPLFHIMGINLGLGALQAGGRNIIMEKFDAAKALELIDQQRATIFGTFPPILNHLIEAAQGNNYDLSSVEITAGIDMPETVGKWGALTGTDFWTMYGQTETSGFVSFAEYNKKPGSAGAVAPLAHIRISDEAGNALQSGETGEILVRGPLVFQGYWNTPELNAHTSRQGWHHTGDSGVVDTDGYLFFKGRKAEKELIKPGGENVFPAEVEQTILEHEGIKEVCVFGVPDPKFGEGIKAVCSLNPGYELTKDDVVKFCASRIAGYKKPRYVTFIDELPKTDENVVDREKIKQEYA